MRKLIFLLGLLLFPALVLAQGTIQQAGPVAPGHPPVWYGNGIQGDPGPASGSPGPGISEQLMIARGSGAGPYPNAGSGPLGTNWCDYDGPVTSPSGYHFFCLSPNAQGGGLLAYGAAGAASTEPLYMNLNGTTYQFPFALSGIVGPSTTISGDIACWNNTVGTLLKDCGAPISTPGSTVVGDLVCWANTTGGSLLDCGPSPNAIREIASGTSDTALVTDVTIDWNSSSASGKTETLYACGTGQKGFNLYIKDEYGNAGTYNIALTPNGSDTIDKNLLNSNLTTNLQGIQLQCQGSGNWIVK
jgi:hypothetical protein